MSLLKLHVSSLKYDLIVDTPANTLVITSSVYLQCPLTMRNRNFLVDLISFPLSQLDVIVRLWLSLDLTFKIIVNAMKIRAILLLKQGILKENAQAYLMLSSLNVKKDMVSSDVLVMKDFQKVFPKDMSSLPLEDKTQSIAPYKMTPLELVELKK
ncbi:hypothetical protein CR513_34082, partial [Mucuna pruriens]